MYSETDSTFPSEIHDILSNDEGNNAGSGDIPDFNINYSFHNEIFFWLPSSFICLAPTQTQEGCWMVGTPSSLLNILFSWWFGSNSIIVSLLINGCDKVTDWNIISISIKYTCNQTYI